mgnify:CR=1 FL=1
MNSLKELHPKKKLTLLLMLSLAFINQEAYATSTSTLSNEITVDELIARGAVLKRTLNTNELNGEDFRLEIDLSKLKECSASNVTMVLFDEMNDKRIMGTAIAPSFGYYSLNFNQNFISSIRLSIDCSDPGWLGPFLSVDLSTATQNSILVELQEVKEVEQEYLGGEKVIEIKRIGEPELITPAELIKRVVSGRYQ